MPPETAAPDGAEDTPPLDADGISDTVSTALSARPEPDGPGVEPTRSVPETFARDAAASDAPRSEPLRVPAAEDLDLADRADRFWGLAPSSEPDPAAGPDAELDPASAPGPVGSANATAGIDATAAPTPTATATAPIRPSEPLTRSEGIDEPIGVPSQ